MSQVDHFDAVAGRYDELRRPGPLARYELLDRLGDLAGKTVLDIGCGTGAHLLALHEHFGCHVAGVDSSPGMLARARAKLPGADLRHARAEALPFPDASFERAVMMLVVHHLDRPHAFAEARRVLAQDGRLLVQTPDPAGFEHGWLAPLFPSYVAVEQRRFPDDEAIENELRGAGFAATSATRHTVAREFSRDEAIARIRGRYASTFDFLSDDEYEAGLARAERELPATVEYTLTMLVVVARR